MTKIKVDILIWDSQNLVHVQKHSVTKSETEEAVSSFVYHKKAHSGRYLVVGRSGKRKKLYESKNL